MKTVIQEFTGKVLRAQFHNEIGDGEILIDEIVTANFIEAYYINGVFVEGATIEQIDAFKRDLRIQIYTLYDSLFESSLARALDKVGQGLTLSQLQSLRQEYELKKEVALAYTTTGSADTRTMELIQFETDVDFAEPRLSNEVAYLNATYGANIPTDQSRLFQYCYLIVVKYNLGSQLWDLLRSLCATFRSKLITDLDNNHFNRINQRIALIKTITNETTVAEILALQTQFDSITN